MYYILIAFSALLFSVSFLFNEKYQKLCGSDLISSFKFSLCMSLFGSILMFSINGFKFFCDTFMFAVACVYGVVNITLNFFTVQALKYANLTVFSHFSMIGGMVVPFIYGIVLGERFTVLKIVCLISIIVSIIINIPREKQQFKAFFCYISIFILNGLVGVISKYYQIHGEVVDSGSFLITVHLLVVLFSALGLLISKSNFEKKFKLENKGVLYAATSSVLNVSANYILLLALLHVDVSVQYPIVTGGVIVFSTVIDFLRKEKVTKRELLTSLIALISTVLIIF